MSMIFEEPVLLRKLVKKCNDDDCSISAQSVDLLRRRKLLVGDDVPELIKTFVLKHFRLTADNELQYASEEDGFVL
ncbi:MAG: hypothetical protein ABH884_03095 [Candidatus Komeilibacteria bacterium]